MMRAVICLVLPILAACTLALPDGGADAPSPLATAEIEVTKLDAPKADGKAEAPIPPEAAIPDAGSTAGAKPAAPDPEAATETPPAEAAPPPALLSPAALACKKKGGRYIKTGSGDLRACVKVTGEEGKRCTRETDCSGSCLARSGTCSPVTPLFGCNEILQADGRRVTLCLD